MLRASVDLRRLRYFVVLAEELHFGRAAERLGISQPPLSQQVFRLEKELGVELFRRTSRRVELTEPGRLFLDEARRTLAQADQAVHVAQRAQRGEVGRLNVGFVPACGVMPVAVRRFARRLPGVKLSLRSMASAAQLAALEAGELDVGFVHLPVDRGALEVEEVQRHPLLAALPTRHRLSRFARVSWRSLEGEPFIGFPRASAPGAYDAILTLFRQAGFGPNVVHETDSLLARLRLVGAGLGISLLPAYASRFPRPGVVLRPLCPPRPYAAIGMAHAPRRATPALARFIAVVRDVAARQA